MYSICHPVLLRGQTPVSCHIGPDVTLPGGQIRLYQTRNLFQILRYPGWRILKGFASKTKPCAIRLIMFLVVLPSYRHIGLPVYINIRHPVCPIGCNP